MAHTISGASLENINGRVGETPGYHPFEAEILSSDWSLEAGDTINIRRGDIRYTSPVTNIRNVWQGTSKATANSTGSKTRGSITKQQQRLYNRGGSAIRSQEHFYREFHSEDGYLHSYVEMTESYLRTEFDDDMNSLRGEFEMTASHLRTEFDDGMNSLHSEFEVTASHLRTEFDDGMNSLRGEFEVTASHLRTEFDDDMNSLRGEFEVTASHLRTEFDDGMNSLRGEFEVTASHLRTEFDDGMNSLRGEFEVTASHLRTEFDDGMNSLRGEFEVTASHLRTEFDDGMNSLRGEFEVTASHLRTEFNDGINSLHGELELTASRLQTTFENEVSGVRSQVTQQADYIGLLVDTTDPSNPSIKAGEIALEMNKEGSVARINANRIKIGGAGSNVTLNDVLSIQNGVAQFKENVYFQKEVTIANTTNSALNLYTMNFVGSNTYTLTPSIVGKMIKTISKDDNTGLVTITLFDGSTVDFRHAASGGDYVTGSWGGGALTVSATPTGESAFIRSFTCGTVDWISNKIADVYVTALKSESGSIITEDDVFSIYVDTEYSYNEGYSSAHVKGTWNNNVFTYQKTNESGYSNSNSVTISSAVAMQLGECYAYATWTSPSSTTPTSIYGTSKKLTIVDSTDNTVKLQVTTQQSGTTDVGLTYTHNKYTAGYNSAHVKGTWNNNVFTYQKTNESGYGNSDSVTISSAVAMQLGECYAYATRTSSSSTTPTSIYGTSKKLTIVDSTDNTVKLQSDGTDVGLTFTHNKYTTGYNAGNTAGYNSAHVKGTWSDNVFTYQKTNESGYGNSDSVTINSVVAMQQGECYVYATRVSASSTTPTSITGTSKKLTIVNSTDNTVKLQSAGSDVGLTFTHNKYTTGYNAGNTAGYNSAHVKGTWNNNVFTYQKTNESGYGNSDSVTISSVVAMQQGECYVYATRTSSSSTTPTSITGTSKKLTIVNSGNNAVKLQSGGTDVGLTFTHNKYTAGQQSITSNGKAAATYYTSTSAQTISGGQYLSGTQTIAAVTTSNIYVGNIKAGVVVKVGDSGNAGRIKNVTGTFTADATAGEGHILSGKTAYVNGNKITGNIASKSAATYYTSTSTQTIAAWQYLSGVQTIAAVSTSNIDAGNIKAGVVVKVGDSGNLGRIKNVTGTFTSDATASAGVILSGYTAYVNGSKVTGTADWDARYWTGFDAGWQRYYDLWEATYDTPGDGTYSYIARSPIDHNNGNYRIVYSSKVPGSGGGATYNNRGSFYISAIENMTGGGKRVRITKEYGASQRVPFTVGNSYTFYTKN